MGEHLIKPYEISVWEDKLIQSGATYKFEERKLAVIGSDTMTGLNKVYDPVFSKKSNGEKTLTFSLKYKYFDPYIGKEGIINPFAALLTNERKVKLHYDNQWYEFIVKDHNESSEDFTWTYTCNDAFVLELSKTGYNITFNADLNNNQGTAEELAEKTLKDTDWRLGGVDNFKQYVAEPLYNGVVQTQFYALNTTTNSTKKIPVNTEVYVFYTYVKNNDGKYVQFIEKNREPSDIIDDKNVITATNYRINVENLTVTNTKIVDSENHTLITIGEIETNYQGNRLAYNQLTTYDPVMQRTVERFKIGNQSDREVYRYTDYTYTTSNVVTNFITNGDNFNTLEDGTLQGWNPYVDFTPIQGEGGDKIDKLELVTKPELGTGKELVDIDKLLQIEGFLKVKFKGARTLEVDGSYKNAIYNSGFENNASLINSISKGDKFVFRWRAGYGDINSLAATTKLRVFVARYTQDEATRYGYYYKHISSSDVLIESDDINPQQLNNYITGGTLTNNDTQYVIDDVPQVPSTRYIYKHNNTNYTWDPSQGKFVAGTTNYLPYYYITATAKKSVSQKEFRDSDTKKKIGIFIYTVNNGPVIYHIQDIQLTRYYEDTETHKPITIGNIPTATSQPTYYYYLKPNENAVAEEIDTYVSPEALLTAINAPSGTILKPLYNEGSQKVLSISESQSNCFNILQSIAETFECWVDLVVDHNEQGYITFTSGKPNKYVYLREYVGKDNWAGFKYGINLQSIERNINSEEIVTKLIVDQTQSDYTDEGFVSITNAPSNQSGESYILNFDYYYNQNLLDRTLAEKDKLNFINKVQAKNKSIQEQEKKKRDLSKTFVELESKRNVYTELIASAQNKKNDALDDFELLTKQTYEEYKEEHKQLIEDDDEDNQKTKEETILDVLGTLYASSATINNYSGILTNLEKQYWIVRKALRGSETHFVKVWVAQDALNTRHIYVEFSDYLNGFKFKLGNSQDQYTVTVSQKYFDISSDAQTITFVTTGNYQIFNNNQQIIGTISINDSAVSTFTIKTNTSVLGVDKKIEQLIEQKNEIIKEFNNKYGRYIQEGTWSATDYIDSERYYLDALQVSNTSAQPTVSYTINVVEVSQLEGLQDFNFDVGDKTYIEDTEFFGWANVNTGTTENPVYVQTPAREEVIISQVEWHLDSPEENAITVQNYKTRFEDLFQRISAAVQTVQYNEATYAKMSTLLDTDGTINQNILVNSLNNTYNYSLTSDGSIIIDGDRILIRDIHHNQNNCLLLDSGGLKISSNGGQTWDTAIDGQGINVKLAYTGTINTNNVIIGNREKPSFRWDKNGINAYKSTGHTVEIDGQTIETYDLQTFVRYDQNGLYGIKNGNSYEPYTLEEIKNKAHFAVTWDGFFIKNSYEGGGKVEITSDNDFRVLNTINGELNEKVKIGALEWEDEEGAITTNPMEGVGAPTLYGIRIKNNAGDTVMETGDDGNLSITGDISAITGHIGGMAVNNNRLEMRTIVLEPGVGIYSKVKTANNDPMFIISDSDGSATFQNIHAIGGYLGHLDVTDLITVGTADTLQTAAIQSYNFSQNDGWRIDNTRAIFNNAGIRGTITALEGDFLGEVNVGNKNSDRYIIIDGVTSTIKTSNYQDGAGYGWMIDSSGDAYFNNITARGAIKTAVFEYAEIQAVGGIFIFRPSSTIRHARISGNNLIVKVEKPALFAKLNTQDYSWVKISNYTTDGSEPDVLDILATNGLSHVYKISNVDISTKEVTLENAIGFISAVQQEDETEEEVLLGLEGGALVDMGREDGSSNYGIGVNSSDNTVNLPRRSISLFDTIVDPSETTKISYKYHGILGTLPTLAATQVSDNIYNRYLANTQGIYTDNMYIGDKDKFVAFYYDSDDEKTKLVITADTIYEGYDTEGQPKRVQQDAIDAAMQVGLDAQTYAEGVQSYAEGVSAQVIAVNNSLNSLNQYFWRKATPTTIEVEGEDVIIPAGSYVSEKPGNTYEANPVLGGFNSLVQAGGIYLRNGITTLSSWTGNALTFNNPITGRAQLVIGANGTIESGNYDYTENEVFSNYGTRIDLTNGQIYSPYFRLADNSDTTHVSIGAHIRGEIEAYTGKIGSSGSNYWEIGNFIDSYEAQSAWIKSYGSAQIQLGNNNSWRLATNRLHTAWTDETAIDNPYYLRFPRDSQNYYWDSGLHVSGGLVADKFLYIRKSHENSGSALLENLNANLDDQTSNTWDYQFYIDGKGSVYAQNFYFKNGNDWTLIAGDEGTYLPIGGGTITGNLTVNGTLTATASNATKVGHNLVIQWGAATTEGTDKFTYNGSATKTITLGNAAIKGVVSTIDSSANLPTSNAVKVYIDNIVNAGTTNAGTGLSKNGNTLNHSNSVTAQTTQALYPIKIDAQGHISGYGSAVTSLPASDVPAWAKAASKPTYTYSEISGTPTALKNPNALTINVYDGSSSASSVITYDGSVANKIANVASNNAITGLGVTVDQDGASTFNITRANGDTDSFNVTIVASAASSAEVADALNVGTVGSTSRPVFFENGKPKQIGYTIQTSVPSGALFTDHTYSAGTGLSLSGSTFNISTVPIANGGTGQTTARNGFHALTGGLTEGTANVTDDTVLMTGNTNAATNDWYYRKASHLYNYIKSKTDTAYLKLTGGIVTGATQINNILTLYREGTTANNYPAGIKFKVKDTTTGQTYDSGYLYAYQDHQSTTYGVNFVLNGGGGLFIGSGESPGAHYSAKGSSYSGEDTFITADGTVYIQGNGNTIANRVGMALNASHQLNPVKADVATNNIGSIGSNSYWWKDIYGTTMHSFYYNIGNKAIMEYDSTLNAVVFSFV